MYKDFRILKAILNIKFARLKNVCKTNENYFANTEMQILDNSHLFTYIYTNRKQTEWWHKGSNLYVHTSIFSVYLTVCAIVQGPYLFH